MFCQETVWFKTINDSVCLSVCLKSRQFSIPNYIRYQSDEDFQFSAVALLITGFWLTFISGVLEPEVRNLLDDIDYEGMQVGFFLFATALLIVITGGVLAFVAVFGACSAWKKFRACYILVSASTWLK